MSDKEKLDQIRSRLTDTVLGSEEAARLLLMALLTNGHVLIQGAPGIGKTTLAATLARSIDGVFSRIQFTPDLLPSDILGYSMFHQGKSTFEFIAGPVFSNIVLADEINRTSPRVQSALLECMNEHQVTIDGVTRPLQVPFMVIATQNNLYASGTFPLPEPQLDRFIMAISMTLPDVKTQAQILRAHADGLTQNKQPPILTAAEVGALQQRVKAIPVNEKVCRYIAAVCESVRAHKEWWHGLSARASIAFMRVAQAAAFLNGNPAVYPDDVKEIAYPVLGHRLASRNPGDIAMAKVKGSLEEILRSVPVP